MVAADTSIHYYSRISLAFLEGTGWYKVDYSVAEKYTWGKNKGCEFLTDNCSTTFKEYCSVEGTSGCSNDYTSKSSCVSTSFSNKCLLNEMIFYGTCRETIDFRRSLINEYEESGVNSRCFEAIQ